MPRGRGGRKEGTESDPFYHKDIEDTESGFKNQEFRVFCDLRLDASVTLVTFVRDGAFWPFWTRDLRPEGA